LGMGLAGLTEGANFGGSGSFRFGVGGCPLRLSVVQMIIGPVSAPR